jgi:hypothetical protein
MEELPCKSKLLILDWRHIVSAHYYWLSTVSFLLNLRWKSYRFYLWILLIKYVFFSSIFAGVATDMQRDKLCSDIPICSSIYRFDLFSIDTTQLRGFLIYIYPQCFTYQMVLVLRDIGFSFVPTLRFGEFHWYCKLFIWVLLLPIRFTLSIYLLPGNAILISGAYARATEKNILKYHKSYEQKFQACMLTIHECMPSFARIRYFLCPV